MKSLNLFCIKSGLFLLIPLSCFLFSCSAESQTIKAKSCLEVRELKGKVKSIRETEYYAEVVDGEIKKDGIKVIMVTSFNKAYTVVEFIQYHPDGRQVAARHIDNYDSNNKLVKVIDYITNNSKPNTMKISSKYDEKGNMIETLGYGTDGKLYNKGTYKYDEKSRMIENISSFLTTSAEQPWFTDTAKYILDAEGRTIEEIISQSGIIIMRNTYKYSNFDNEGNWLVKTTGDPPESITERVIEYY
ncbi:MAG: hypothetical protein NTZ85_02920 [Bacteroidia bacterium]|nr:hypothetical protein [Bacteroidia bacterium]